MNGTKWIILVQSGLFQYNVDNFCTKWIILDWKFSLVLLQMKQWRILLYFFFVNIKQLLTLVYILFWSTLCVSYKIISFHFNIEHMSG